MGIARFIGTQPAKVTEQALDAEPPLESFLKSMLIGGTPVNANRSPNKAL